jgi:hypothetical protein
MSERTRASHLLTKTNPFPFYGWLGLGLASLFWLLNWKLSGLRTYWAFFPMWLGYCLAMDAWVYARTGTSLLRRSRSRFVGLFLASAPMWWIFEALNSVTQNWVYRGAEGFRPVEYAFWTTLSFTTVLPAVFETAELFASFPFLQKLGPGLAIGRSRRAVFIFFLTGLVMLVLMLLWPKILFPFIWISLYFIIEPLNIWLGNRSLADWTRQGDWRPVMALWSGVLFTAFFWEMWNYFSYPKWIYQVSWGDWLHIFEMPLLGYGGYLPFALELYALYHLLAGASGDKHQRYIRIGEEPAGE